MWISVVRVDVVARDVTDRGMATHPPSISLAPPSRPERRRRDERASELAAAQSTAGHPRPRQVGSTPPSRRSFRLTGGAPDPGCGHALLPLWLEESSGATFPATLDAAVKGTDQESSFEKRWDSLLNKSKIHSSCQTQRPPSWDDVAHRNSRVKKDKKSSFCPSIVIQEPSRAWPATSVHHKIPAPPASGRSRQSAQQTQCWATHEQNSLSMTGFYEQVHEIFTDDFLQIPLQHASSTSSLGTESSTSEGPQLSVSIDDVAQQSSIISDAPEQLPSTSYEGQPSYSTSDVGHQPSSTSHVSQQCYSDSGGTQQLSSTSTEGQQSSVTEEIQPSTSSMTQQSSSHASAAQESSSNASDCHMWLSSDSFFCEDFTCSDAGHRNDDAAESHELDSHQSPSCPSMLQSSNPEAKTISEPEAEEEMQLSASSSPCRPSESTRFDSPSCDADSAVSGEAATLRVTDALRRQHWVHFDSGPTEQSVPHVTAAVGTGPSASSPDTAFKPAEVNFQPLPPATVANLAVREKPRSSPTHTGNYSGRLIRTYSQRGCRASKRVINSVSRRMSATEYDRLSEPQPPMYSKAVMTMQTGPGLFEKTLERTESERPSEEEKRFQPEDLKAKPMSSLEEPAVPRRVGSMRAPSMSAKLLRRSLSLHSPRKAPSEVPFQKLSEQRPGSFRRALGALARSFRRKSSSANIPDVATNENNSFTPGKQTPQAPRLPRRAARQRYASTHDWDRPAQLV